MKKFEFRGMATEVTPERIRDRDPNKFYYEIRHAGGKENAPRTIEPSVLVDFAGTMVTEQQLDLGPERCIFLERTEFRHLAHLI